MGGAPLPVGANNFINNSRARLVVVKSAMPSTDKLKVASLIDLAGTKASVVQVRAEARDYIDIDALMSAGIDLPTALAAGQAIYGRQFNPELTLKALSYFDDGSLRQLPEPLKGRLAKAARVVDLDRLPELKR